MGHYVTPRRGLLGAVAAATVALSVVACGSSGAPQTAGTSPAAHIAATAKPASSHASHSPTPASSPSASSGGQAAGRPCGLFTAAEMTAVLGNNRPTSTSPTSGIFGCDYFGGPSEYGLGYSWQAVQDLKCFSSSAEATDDYKVFEPEFGIPDGAPFGTIGSRIKLFGVILARGRYRGCELSAEAGTDAISGALAPGSEAATRAALVATISYLGG